MVAHSNLRDREEAKQRRKDKEVLKKMKKVGLPQAIANASKVRTRVWNEQGWDDLSVFFGGGGGIPINND